MNYKMIQFFCFSYFSAGANMIGVNCYYDPDVCLETMKIMKQALEKEGLKRHLIVQPMGYKTPECLDHSNPARRMGITGLAEFPYGVIVKILQFLIDCRE